MLPQGIASRVLERSLRPLSKVQTGEGMSSLLMLACVFLLLTSYYVMKTAREGMILAGGAFGLHGDELKAYTNGAMAVLLIAVVPLYGRLASRVRRIALINITYAIVAACLIVFYVLNRLGVPVGLVFYVWLGIVSLLLVAQFWSYANDTHTEEQGKRLFPVIAVGGSLGAIIGPRVAGLADTFTLLPIAATMLVGSVALLNAVESHNGRQSQHVAEAPIAGPGGFTLVMRDPYLLLIASMLIVLSLVNTTGEYILANAARDHAMAMTPVIEDQREIIKSFYGNFYSMVNLLAFVVQAFAVSRLIERFGVRRLLYVMPFVVLTAYTAIAVAGTLAVVRAAKLAENSTDYSLQNTLRQTLYLPLSRAAKYKAKAAIETFFVRAGDLLAALLVFVGIHELSLGRASFAVVNISLVAVWIAICVGLASYHRRRSHERHGDA